MTTFNPGDLVRLAHSDLEMLIICEEEYSMDAGGESSFWRCAWEEDGAIATAIFNQCNLLLLRAERRRLPRFDLKFPVCKRVKNVH